MKFNRNLLSSAVRTCLVMGAVGVASFTAPAFAQDKDKAQRMDDVVVTGTSIKRAEVEGALPVTVLDRQQLQTSGEVSVADFLRETNFNSFGSYQSTSGSSGQGATTINLRGLGSERTLVLVDGRRAPVAPMLGSGQDLNSIPMAAVERIEVLTDGASSIYGSDAIAGVVNVITRKDYDGVEFSIGMGRPTEAGGDTEEMSLVMGTTSDNGRVLVGASSSSRDVVFTRDRDYWYTGPGASSFSNNFMTQPSRGFLNHPVNGPAVPGLCTNGDDSDLFWQSANRFCNFNHSATSANLTSLKSNAVFARGDYQINDDWSVYFSASVNRTRSFGRYAPVPSSPWPGGAIILRQGSPNHPATSAANGGLNPQFNDPYYQQFAGQDLYLRHRFAALGTRDNHTENTTYNYVGGFQGSVGRVDLDFGMHYAESRAGSDGSNYVVAGLAQNAIDSGAYNIYDPYAGNPGSLGLTTATSRDMRTTLKEVYGTATFNLFDMGGGSAALALGLEHREEGYKDIYDALSEAGQVVGSSGNSAAGDRKVDAAYLELLLPIANSFELNFAGRYDKYSDYGSDFSPKASLRWHPIDSLTVRASYGKGFRAPSLDILHAKASFSADRTNDPQTCLMLTGNTNCVGQLNTYRIANPNLGSEKSTQWSAGVVWDPTSWLNLSLDYYNIKIDEEIAFISSPRIIGCLRGTLDECPPGLSRFPQNTDLPNPSLGLGAEFDPATGGVVVLQSGYANLGTTETQGADFSLRTNFDFDTWGSLRNHLTVSNVLSYKVNGEQSSVGRKGTPRYRATLTNGWSIGDVDLSWTVNYIHGSQSGAYREWLALERLAGQGPLTPGQLDDYQFYAEQPKTLPSWTTHNVQASVKLPWDATFTLGVNNVANKPPMFEALYGGTDYDDALYDPWGRVPYMRYTQRF